jgi:hypothetical protein
MSTGLGRFYMKSVSDAFAAFVTRPSAKYLEVYKNWPSPVGHGLHAAHLASVNTDNRIGSRACLTRLE